MVFQSEKFGQLLHVQFIYPFGNVLPQDEVDERFRLVLKAVMYLGLGISCPPLVCATRDSLSESGDV
jgi:hypothetical protein